MKVIGTFLTLLMLSPVAAAQDWYQKKSTATKKCAGGCSGCPPTLPELSNREKAKKIVVEKKVTCEIGFQITFYSVRNRMGNPYAAPWFDPSSKISDWLKAQEVPSPHKKFGAEPYRYPVRDVSIPKYRGLVKMRGTVRLDLGSFRAEIYPGPAVNAHLSIVSPPRSLLGRRKTLYYGKANFGLPLWGDIVFDSHAVIKGKFEVDGPTELVGREYDRRCGRCPEKLRADHQEWLYCRIRGLLGSLPATASATLSLLDLLDQVSIGVGPVKASLAGTVKVGPKFSLGPFGIDVGPDFTVLKAPGFKEFKDRPKTPNGGVVGTIEYLVASVYDGSAETSRYVFSGAVGVKKGERDVESSPAHDQALRAVYGKAFGAKKLTYGKEPDPPFFFPWVKERKKRNVIVEPYKNFGSYSSKTLLVNSIRKIHFQCMLAVGDHNLREIGERLNLGGLSLLVWPKNPILTTAHSCDCAGDPSGRDPKDPSGKDKKKKRLGRSDTTQERRYAAHTEFSVDPGKRYTFPAETKFTVNGREKRPNGNSLTIKDGDLVTAVIPGVLGAAAVAVTLRGERQTGWRGFNRPTPLTPGKRVPVQIPKGQSVIAALPQGDAGQTPAVLFESKDGKTALELPKIASTPEEFGRKDLFLTPEVPKEIADAPFVVREVREDGTTSEPVCEGDPYSLGLGMTKSKITGGETTQVVAKANVPEDFRGKLAVEIPGKEAVFAENNSSSIEKEVGANLRGDGIPLTVRPTTKGLGGNPIRIQGELLEKDDRQETASKETVMKELKKKLPPYIKKNGGPEGTVKKHDKSKPKDGKLDEGEVAEVIEASGATWWGWPTYKQVAEHLIKEFDGSDKEDKAKDGKLDAGEIKKALEILEGK